MLFFPYLARETTEVMKQDCFRSNSFINVPILNTKKMLDAAKNRKFLSMYNLKKLQPDLGHVYSKVSPTESNGDIIFPTDVDCSFAGTQSIVHRVIKV